MEYGLFHKPNMLNLAKTKSLINLIFFRIHSSNSLNELLDEPCFQNVLLIPDDTMMVTKFTLNKNILDFMHLQTCRISFSLWYSNYCSSWNLMEFAAQQKVQKTQRALMYTSIATHIQAGEN